MFQEGKFEFKHEQISHKERIKKGFDYNSSVLLPNRDEFIEKTRNIKFENLI
jgi:hypothetical protein